jgi:hypothetical protein
MTPCTNTTCPIWVTCQKKATPFPACSGTTRVLQNGYAAMAQQEQSMRMSAIDYSGDWSVP